jgi:hypothetical protein
MLQGQHSQVLPEWLAIAAQMQQRLPELYLPDLLDLGRQRRDLRAAILPVLGQRGRWLARQNPEWAYAIEVATEEDWETGSISARVLYLQDLRPHNPDRARDLLQAIWSQEVAGDRARLLETLRIGLSLADEPFLQAQLGDRSKEVRRLAADLLASLPDSHVCQQVTAHVTRYLTLIREPNPALQVKLPAALDATLIQCGIEPKLTRQGGTNLGEKGWWLLQLIGATPLTVWEAWEMSPAEIVRCARKHEWEAVLLDGWALAAKRQQNAVWSEALLNVWTTGKAFTRTVALSELGIEALWDMIPPDRQNFFLINLLESGRGDIDQSVTIWLLRQNRHEWSVELAQLVLDRLNAHLAQPSIPTNFTWELRTALKEFACFIPVSLLTEVTTLQTAIQHTYWVESMEALLTLLQFRQEMIQAFESSKGG